MKEIPLTQGKVALVDDEDYAALNAFKWSAYRGGRTWYAVRAIRRPGGGQTTESLHRVVLARKLNRDLTKKEYCDHVDGDGLDDRRENLRSVTWDQNMRNCWRRKADATSQYMGVSWHKARGKWRARIRVPGKVVFLGYHATDIDAAMVREAYIGAHPELCARSNFTQPTQGDSK